MRALLFVALLGCNHEPPRVPTNPAPQRRVVLVSIDGMMPDAYLNPDAHGLKVPTFRMIAAKGAISDGVVPQFPSVTYPCHTTMVTGVPPGKHGIVSNKTFDPLERDFDGWRWYKEDVRVPTIYDLVLQNGGTTGVVWWPVTVGARATSLVPEYWRAKNENDRKLVRAISTPDLLESVAREHPDFWTRFNPPRVRDSAITDVAIHILEHQKPTLLLVHLVEVDGSEHEHGVWSKETISAIEEDDAQVGRILAAAGPDTDVIVASDHGFINVTRAINPCALLAQAGLIAIDKNHTVDWKVALLSSSGQAYGYLKDPNDKDSFELAKKIFTDKIADKESGIARFYEPDEIRALGGDPNAAFAIEASPGVHLGASCTQPYVSDHSPYRGTHGYDPRRPELRASLLLYGPHVAHGTIEDARMIDIAPTIASWLGIAMNADGKPLVVRAAK